MRLRYKQFACRTLTLILWLAVSYGLYFHHIATQDYPTETDNRTVEMGSDALPPSDDASSRKWTTDQTTSVTTENSTDPAERSRGKGSRTKQRSLRSSLRSKVSLLTRTSIPGLLPKKPISVRVITPKKVKGKRVAAMPGSFSNKSISKTPIIPEKLKGKPVAVMPGLLPIKPISVRTITPKKVKGKPISPKQNSTVSVKSAPVSQKVRKVDPMDEYSDMGGIVIKGWNSSMPVNPHPFHYTLNPEKTCDVGSSPSELFLLVYVHTRPNSIKQRELIRSTWGDVRNYAVTVRRIFVMGLPEGEYVQEAVKLESNLYHDILQENFLDTYHNLTYKAVGALRWVKDYCSNAKFVLKTDDDAFVNMPILLDLLVSKHKKGLYGPHSLICNAWHNNIVPRGGKWAVTVAQRKHPTWPTFCQGLAFILTPSAAAEMYNASFDVPFLWMDDVYVTGFLAKKIGISHTQITDRFIKEVHIERLLKNEKQWTNVLFSHIQNFDRSRWAWNRVMKLRNDSNAPTVTGKPLLPTPKSTKPVVPLKQPLQKKKSNVPK